MPSYIVELDRALSGQTFFDGGNTATVFAADATAAKELVKSMLPGTNPFWDDATVTEVIAAADFNGWTFRAKIRGATENGDYEKVGDVTDNTCDEIGTALATILNASANIANASHNTTSNVLTVAAIADSIGDHILTFEIVPPGGDSSVASLVGTIVDGGIAGADITVALPADAAVIPNLQAFSKQ